MPDSWSEFDERWRVDDDHRRRERREEQRRKTRRRRLVALFAVVVLAGVGAYVATSSGGGSASSSADAPVTTVGRPPADTVAKTTKTTAARPPLTPAQKRTAAEHAAVATFLKRSWFVTQGGKRKREMALTFDDGPGPYTERIMRILRANHVPATFFQIGSQIPTFASVVRKQVREGFVIGDHTEGHVPLAGKPRSLQREQIADVAAQLHKVGAPAPILFRPPTGVWDRNTRQLLKRKGMLTVFWSIDTEDYQQPGTQRIVHEVLTNAKPGAIVLMHDGGGNREQTVDALPAIIKGLKARGFKLVTIPRLIQDAPPRKKKPAPFGQGPGL